MLDPKRVYRSLLKLHPAHFREEYGGPLERQFRDEYREVRGRGRRMLFWLRVLGDLAASIPAQFAHEIGQDLRHAARVYVAIVNEALARQLGVSSGMAGRRVLCYMGRKQYTIVGVVRTQRFNGPSMPGWARMFTHLDQQPPTSVSFVVRTPARPEWYLSSSRSAVQEVDRQVPVYDVQTMSQRLDEFLAGARVYTMAILFFAVLATLLAVIGVYSVAAHSIAQRTHEIGVRIAVGAAPMEVRLMILRQSVLPVVGGMIAGIAASRGLDRLMGHLIDQAQPVGGWVCGVAALVTISTAAAAVWTATHRMMRVDPMSALRSGGLGE